jgi:drug/metabolite transporter (DMT)-like permease
VPASAFFLALGAAALHASWNILLARARDVRAATAVALALAVVLFAPVAAATWRVEASAWPWILASAALELVYFFLLTTAYSGSDVSLVYPIARGTAPVLVLVGATLAGVALTAGEAIGVVLVGGGVLFVRGLRGRADARGIVIALAIAITIAGYTLVDKEGVQHASAIPYLELVLTPAAVVAMLGYVFRGTLDKARAELGLATVGAALASFGAYALVLAALQLAPAAAVAAVRESSILFAVLLAALVLREPVGPSRLAGACLVVAGVALVALS